MMAKRYRNGIFYCCAMLLFMGGSFTNPFVSAAYAGVKLTDKLTLSSDFRFRYEIDDERSTSRHGTRDRARIRARVGLTYDLTDWVRFGVRLRTRADTTQSPHQTLGGTTFGSGSTQRESDDFGLDRAYIKFKWLQNGFAWLGKNQAAIWQQNEQFWDADYQAEGVTVGYALPLRGKSHLTLQGSYYIVDDLGFGTDGGGGVFNDTAIFPIQAVYKRDISLVGLTVAGLVAPTTGRGGPSSTLPGGDSTYYMGSVEAKLKGLPIPVRVGYEAYYGSFGTVGHGAGVRVKPLKGVPLELRGYYYYIPVDSVPFQGAIVQDNFRFSSNFKGFQLMAAYKILPNLQIDFRAYPQDTIDEALGSRTSHTVPGLGSYVQGNGYTTRYQTNLDIKF